MILLIIFLLTCRQQPSVDTRGEVVGAGRCVGHGGLEGGGGVRPGGREGRRFVILGSVIFL